jgi:RNA polymerase sigma-70 factor (ECF subfamily)
MTDSARPNRADDEERWSLLMVSGQAGCEADYRQLLTELGAVINQYLRSRLGQQHFIEDCVQESLIAIHQARHSYDPSRPFRAWLFAIVRHKAIDVLRRQRSQRQIVERRQQAALVEAADVGSAAALDLASGRLLQSLSSQHREAITLTKILGLSTTEAAAQLHISETALKVRVHRAVVRLRRLLEVEPS